MDLVPALVSAIVELNFFNINLNHEDDKIHAEDVISTLGELIKIFSHRDIVNIKDLELNLVDKL